jgi:Zn-dependent protease with chaperone function
MTGIEAVRGLLPAYVLWAPLLFLPAAFVVSWLCAALGAIVVLRPLRRGGDLGWAERARLAYPARIAARQNALLLGLTHAALAYFLAPALGPLPRGALVLLTFLAGYAGAVLVSFRVERRVRQGRFTAGALVRALLVQWLIFFGGVLILVVVMPLMPLTFNARAWALLGLAAAAALLYQIGVGFHVAWLLGLVRPAPARAQEIVARIAASMAVPVRGVHELNFPLANAFAFPFLGRIAFTPSLLAALDDEELAVVAAHELAHLSESRLALLGRLTPVFLLLSLAATAPLVGDFGPLAPVALVVPFVLLVAVLVPRLSRRLERRADDLAKGRQAGEGVYARALSKVYEANLAPLVEPGKGTTHPHLYDRLVAVGSPPDFPRPQPPPRLRGVVAGCVTGAALLALWGGLFFARFRFAPRGTDEPAVLRSLALGGRTAIDLNDLAAMRSRAGKYDEATLFFQAAAESDPSSPYHPANQAITLAHLGRCAEAKAAAEEAHRRQVKHRWPDGDNVVRMAREAALGCERRKAR